MSRIVGTMVLDGSGRVIDGVSDSSVEVSGNVTDTVVIALAGVLFRLMITKDVDGGTWTLKNNAGTTLLTGVTDYVGTLEIRKRYETGVKITTTGFTGGEMSLVKLE